MPPKARIDDDSFKQALSTLDTDQLRQLDAFSSTDPLWGYLCVSMGKANNAENRRACYDAYKRKQLKFQPLVNQLIQGKGFEPIVRRLDASPLPLPSNDRSEMIEISNPTQVAIACQVCKLFHVCLSSICVLFCRMSGALCRSKTGLRRSRFYF